MRGLMAFFILLIGCTGGGSDSSSGGGDDGDTICPDVAVVLRDPATGACHVVTACDDDGNKNPDLDQATCHSSCDSLSEADCINAAGCQPAYVIGSTPGGGTGSFYGCWSTAGAKPIHAGVCAGLGAQDCSYHDNCSPRYTGSSAGTTQFDSCADKS